MDQKQVGVITVRSENELKLRRKINKEMKSKQDLHRKAVESTRALGKDEKKVIQIALIN